MLRQAGRQFRDTWVVDANIDMSPEGAWMADTNHSVSKRKCNAWVWNGWKDAPNHPNLVLPGSKLHLATHLAMLHKERAGKLERSPFSEHRTLEFWAKWFLLQLYWFNPSKKNNKVRKMPKHLLKFFAEPFLKAQCYRDTKMFVPLLEETRTMFPGSFPSIRSDGVIALGGESVFSAQKKCCVYSCELYADVLRDVFGAQLLASIEELKRSCQRLYGGAENITQRREQHHMPFLHKLVCAEIQNITERDARVGLQIWRELDIMQRITCLGIGRLAQVEYLLEDPERLDVLEVWVPKHPLVELGIFARTGVDWEAVGAAAFGRCIDLFMLVPGSHVKAATADGRSLLHDVAAVYHIAKQSAWEPGDFWMRVIRSIAEELCINLFQNRECATIIQGHEEVGLV